MGKPQKGTEARAEALFWVYHGLGGGRSLRTVSELVRDLGVTVSSKTLERYSARFGWQSRIEETDAKMRARREERQIEAALDMNVAQAELGRAMRAWAQNRLDSLSGDEGSIQDVARLAKDGSYIERLAMGEATDRREILVAVYSRAVIEIGMLFKQINEFPDPGKRERAFATGVDEIVTSRLTASPPS